MAEFKRASVLRRVGPVDSFQHRPVAGGEGNVCAFELTQDDPITIEAESGRPMVIAPGDVFFSTPGSRDGTRWVGGGLPPGGLIPNHSYWVLADCGIVGELFGETPPPAPYLGEVKYLGTLYDRQDRELNLRRFALSPAKDRTDYGASVFVLVGTSAEAGKTTAGLAVLESLRHHGRSKVVALKATGTASVRELMTYRDFGAVEALDFVDFGLPATSPANRADIAEIFEHMLDTCLSTAADAVIIECGSDMLGVNVPIFLGCLKRRRSHLKIILAATDPFGALGGKMALKDMGLEVDLITGPCTDTPTVLERTRTLCGVTALNMFRRGTHDVL